jgi:hypothetical protein
VPRFPQPISAIRTVSLPATWTACATAGAAANAPAAETRLKDGRPAGTEGREVGWSFDMDSGFLLVVIVPCS